MLNAGWQQEYRPPGDTTSKKNGERLVRGLSGRWLSPGLKVPIAAGSE